VGLLVVAFFIVLATLPTFGLIGLSVWARWLRRRTAAPRLGVWAAYVLLALGAVGTIAGPIVGGLRSLAAIHGASSPADRSRLLASGISELMWNQALTTLIGLLAALWLLFATWRWHWARQ
jgi:hypothetical protein